MENLSLFCNYCFLKIDTRIDADGVKNILLTLTLTPPVYFVDENITDNNQAINKQKNDRSL